MIDYWKTVAETEDGIERRGGKVGQTLLRWVKKGGRAERDRRLTMGAIRCKRGPNQERRESECQRIE